MEAPGEVILYKSLTSITGKLKVFNSKLKLYIELFIIIVHLNILLLTS